MPTTIDTIPEWDSSAVIPAIDFGHPTSRDRSPYKASALSIVKRFGHTSKRRRLLMGLLEFRADLHKAGLLRGFQWLNGSFAENVEGEKGEDPCDIDLVTFYRVPDGYTQSTLFSQYPDLFRHGTIKADYGLDTYFVTLNQVNPEEVVTRSTYWYSLFSHRREDYAWKGYVQIDLAADRDVEARNELEAMDKLGGPK